MLSVDLFVWCKNCSGSSGSGREEVRKALTNCSVHFVMVEVSAIGWSSIRHRAFSLSWNSTMVSFLKKTEAVTC